MSGKVIGNLQLGNSNVNTALNFVFQAPSVANGTMRLSRGDLGSNDDIFSVDTNGNVCLNRAATLPSHAVRLDQQDNLRLITIDGADHVLAMNESGVYHSNADAVARIITIDTDANVPYPQFKTLSFIVRGGAGALTLHCAETLIWAPSGTSGDRILTGYGVATATKLTPPGIPAVWLISGTNLS